MAKNRIIEVTVTLTGKTNWDLDVPAYLLDRKILRKQVAQAAAAANKRLARLQKADLATPAYEKWLREGGQKFGVKGKTQEELIHERARVRQFLKAKTSTITGAKEVANQLAKNVGIVTSSDFKRADKQLATFFRIVQKVDEYNRSLGVAAGELGYNKIWQAVSKQIKQDNVDLSSAHTDVEGLAHTISKALQVAPRGWERFATTDLFKPKK